MTIETAARNDYARLAQNNNEKTVQVATVLSSTITI